jgi:hypothetical protein
VIVDQPYVLESTAIPGDQVVLAQMKMGSLTAHASVLALTGQTTAAHRHLDASTIFAQANKIIDFTGYYLSGPDNAAYNRQFTELLHRPVTWDITQAESLPSASGDWRPWQWPDGVDPVVLLVHSDGKAMAIVINDHEEYYRPQAVAAWARLSRDLRMGARPLVDPLVLMCCAGAQSSQTVANEVGRLVFGPTGNIGIGARAIDLADQSAGVRVGVTLYRSEDGRADRFGSAYPQGPAGDRIRWAYRERVNNDDASWIAEQLATPGTLPPQAIRPREIKNADHVVGWCYFDERDFRSRGAALTPAAISSSYVTWIPNHAYRPGTPRTADPQTGKIIASAEPWHIREQGTLPFSTDEMIFVAGHFIHGSFVVADPNSNVSFFENPQDFGRRLRRDYEAFTARMAHGSGPPPAVFLLTDTEPVPEQAISLVRQNAGDIDIITVSLPATLYSCDLPGAGHPQTGVALIPGSGDTSTPVFTRRSSSQTATQIPPVIGSNGPARPAQPPPARSAMKKPALATRDQPADAGSHGPGAGPPGGQADPPTKGSGRHSGHGSGLPPANLVPESLTSAPARSGEPPPTQEAHRSGWQTRRATLFHPFSFSDFLVAELLSAYAQDPESHLGDSWTESADDLATAVARVRSSLLETAALLDAGQEMARLPGLPTGAPPQELLVPRHPAGGEPSATAREQERKTATAGSAGWRQILLRALGDPGTPLQLESPETAVLAGFLASIQGIRLVVLRSNGTRLMQAGPDGFETVYVMAGDDGFRAYGSRDLLDEGTALVPDGSAGQVPEQRTLTGDELFGTVSHDPAGSRPLLPMARFTRQQVARRLALTLSRRTGQPGPTKRNSSGLSEESGSKVSGVSRSPTGERSRSSSIALSIGSRAASSLRSMSWDPEKIELSLPRVVPVRPPPGAGPPGGLQPPDRIRMGGRLSASDPIISLYPGDDAPWQVLSARLAARMGGRWRLVAEVLRPLFASGAVKPLLSGLARGEEKEMLIVVGGTQVGGITLDAHVVGESFAHDGHDPISMEFEAGADSQANSGSFSEGRWRGTGGFLIRGSGNEYQYNGAPGGYRDLIHLKQTDDSGRTVSKTKTVEPGVVFNGLIEVGLTIKFHSDPEPLRDATDVTVAVGVPRAECRDEAGNLPEVAEHYALPPRITSFRRFGSSDTIWDVYIPATGPVRPGSTARVQRRTVAAWIEQIEADGQHVFGRRAWPDITKQIREQVQPDTVHQRLKGMGSGQPIVVHGLPEGASVEVTMQLTYLKHARSTKHPTQTTQVEFASGTSTSRINNAQVAKSQAVSLPIPGQNLGNLPDTFELGGNVLGSVGKDHQRLRSDGANTGMETKLKDHGEVYDGTFQLLFAMRHTGIKGTRSRVATADAGVRAVIERAETVRAESDVETIWQAPREDPPPAPDTVTALRAGQGEAAINTAKTVGLPVPPDQIWSNEPGMGQPDTAVVLDMWGLQRLRRTMRRELQRVLDPGNQLTIESAVLDSYQWSRLMAHLAEMTRGTALNGPEFAHRLWQNGTRPLPGQLEIAATAQVEALMLHRLAPKVELAPQGAVGWQISERRFQWWTAQLQGQFGGWYNEVPTQMLLPTIGGQFRQRIGWLSTAGGQSVANAKFGAQYVYYLGLVRISFTVSLANRRADFDVVLPFEVGIPAGLTATVPPMAVQAWLATGQPLPATPRAYERLIQHTEKMAGRIGPAPGLKRLPSGITEQWQVRAATRYLVAKPPDTAKLIVPPRVTGGRLSRSDLVVSIDPDTNQLVNHIVQALRPKLGKSAIKQTERTARRNLDTQVVKPRIAGMTSGDVIMVKVSGKWWSWSGHVAVAANAGLGIAYRETTPKIEFEAGTEDQSIVGLSVEALRRAILGVQYKGKLPHTSLTITGTHNRDVTEGLITLKGSQEVAKGKTVEAGALLKGSIKFHIDYDLRRFRLLGPLAPRLNPPLSARHLSMPVLVVVPQRDMRGPAATGSSTPAKWFALPRRVQLSGALSSSDIVLDIAPIIPDNRRPFTMADVLTAAGLDGPGRFVFDRSWRQMRQKLLDEVDLARIHNQLKSAMARHPIVVAAPHGANGRILITASLTSAEHVSSTEQTEFNTGTQQFSSRSTADPRTTSSKAQSTALVVTALGTSDPTGELGLAGVGGPTVSGALGMQNYEVVATQGTAGMTTKVKGPGAVYNGRVTLHFRLESRRFLRPQRLRQHPVQVNTQFLTEQAESLAVDSQEETEFPGAAPLREQPPNASDSVAPPARVWGLQPGEGLRDSDTIRGLPDTGGLFWGLDAAGRAVFGRKGWRRLAPVAQAGTAHSALAAGLPSMTRGGALLNPMVFRGPRYPASQIGGQARILSMRYVRTEKKAEVNPVNEARFISARSRQYWWAAGLQGQGGVKVGPVTLGVIGGATYRDREATLHSNTGRVLSNLKKPTPTAIYDAYALVKFTLREGANARVIPGVIPVEVGIPVEETSSAAGITEFRPPEPHEDLEAGSDDNDSARPLSAAEHRAAGLMGPAHGMSAKQLARVFDLVARLHAAEPGPPGVSLAAYLAWLGGKAGAPSRGEKQARQLFGLLGLAADGFTNWPVQTADLNDLRWLSMHMQTARDRPPGWRPATANDLRAEFRARRGLPIDAEVAPADVSELARTARIEAALRSGHGFSQQQLADSGRLAARLRQAGHGPAGASIIKYLEWLGREAGIHAGNPGLSGMARQLTGLVSKTRVVGLLNLAGNVFGHERVTFGDLFDLRPLYELAARRADGKPVTIDHLLPELRPRGDLPAQVTVGNLPELVRMTHAGEVLGADHEFSPEQLARLFRFVGQIRQTVPGPVGASAAEYLRWLGGAVGVLRPARSENTSELIGAAGERHFVQLLGLAEEISRDQRPGLAVGLDDLAALQRLVDELAARRGDRLRRRPVTAEDLRAEHRIRQGLAAEVAVNLRELVRETWARELAKTLQLGDDDLASAASVVDRLRATGAGPADVPGAAYLRWLGGEVGVLPVDRAAAERLFELLSLAGEALGDSPVGVADVAELQRLGDEIRTRPADQPGPRGDQLTALQAEYRSRLGLPASAEVSAANLRELVLMSRAQRLFGSGHGLTDGQLARALRLAGRIHPAGADPADRMTAAYLGWLAREVSPAPAPAGAGSGLTHVASASRLAGLLNLAWEVYQDDPVTVTDIIGLGKLIDQAAARRASSRAVPQPPTVDELHAAVRAREGLAADTRVAKAALRELVRNVGSEAAETAQLQTMRRHARDLLGSGHRFSDDQLARVFKMIGQLRRDAGFPAHTPTSAYLRTLAGAVGLHQHDWPRHSFSLLDLATEVFGHVPVPVATLADLRRLSDLLQARLGRPVTVEDLRNEYRALLGDDPADLRELVAITRAAKAARRAAGGGRVRQRDLRDYAKPRRTAHEAAREIRAYLGGSIQLDISRQRQLLDHLLPAAAGGTCLEAVLDLLEAAHEDEVRKLFDDDGRLLAALGMAFVGTGPLLERYRHFLHTQFRGGRAALRP